MMRSIARLVQPAASSHPHAARAATRTSGRSAVLDSISLLVRLIRRKSCQRQPQTGRDFPLGVLAAVLAYLAFSGAAGQACQLSLLGAVMQQPLTYNPFEAGASPAAISFTLKNADTKPCDAAFAFFTPGAAQASGPGGQLNYQIAGANGPLTQNAVSPPSVLPGPANAAYFTVGAKQTYAVRAALTVSEGQVVPPGIYTGTLYLGVYQSAGGGGQYTRAQIPVAALGVAIGVNSQMTVAIAGGGRKTTLNFGDFVQGAVRTVQLQAYANQGFRLFVSSDNAGVMKPTDKQALAEGIWQVPYTIAINKMAPVSLSQRQVLSLWPPATRSSGIAIPIDVQIGSIAGQRAGIYRDVITIAIGAAP